MDLFITSENGNLVQNGDVIKPPLFKLYDNVGVELDNIAKYPNSIHAGNKIFNYNETASGTKDTVLGLKLTRKYFGYFHFR